VTRETPVRAEPHPTEGFTPPYQTTSHFRIAHLLSDDADRRAHRDRTERLIFLGVTSQPR
jgi:hypothetical protein